MVWLYNITRDEITIQCDYCPENKEYRGHIVMDIATRKVLRVEPSLYPYVEKHYCHFAQKRLAELIDKEVLPEKAYAAWY